MMSEDAHDHPVLAEIRDLANEARVEIRWLSGRRLDERALTEAHQGVIAHADEISPVDVEHLLRGPSGRPPFLVALDGVTDPGNLGAVLRTAEVVGATGVVLPRHRAVRLTPAAVKAAAGAVEHLPIALVGGLPSAMTLAGQAGVWTVGLDGGAPRSVFDMTVADQPVMVVLGAEGRGLSHLVTQRCDQVVSIPQAGRTESLNVAAAAAVALYEVHRRRTDRSGGAPSP